MILYTLVDGNSWEIEPDEFFTDVSVAGPRSEELHKVLVAINIPNDGGPSSRLWSGMRKVSAWSVGWEWFGPDMEPLDAAPVSW